MGEDMSGLGLAIIDTDSNYMESVAGYITTNYGLSFSVYCFSTLDLFMKDAGRRPERFDIILVSPEFYSREHFSGFPGTVILLEKNSFHTKREMPSVFKYRHCDSIIGEILDIRNAQGHTDSRLHGGLSGTRVVGVYSPVGGAGKSTVSTGLAVQCARRGMKVFYLNLESAGSTSSFFGTWDGPGFSKILFSLKCNRASCGREMVSSGTVCGINGINYYLPPDSPFEWDELSSDDYAFLVKQLKNAGIYNVVLIDMDSAISKKNFSILQKCDVILLLTIRNLIAAEKMQILHREILRVEEAKEYELSSKIVGIENKYANRNLHSPKWEVMPGHMINERLPYSWEIEASEGSDIFFDDRNTFVEILGGINSEYVLTNNKFMPRGGRPGGGSTV
jgi:cellulose biosynthesis protein BcsQ